MLRLASAFILMLFISGSAFSQEYETEDRFDWSGYFIGIHAGYGWGNNSWDLIRNGSGSTVCGLCGSEVTDFDVNGMLGGIQAGYNHQFENLVIGIEAEFSLSGADGRGTWLAGSPTALRDAEADISWVASLGPRLGWAYDHTLLYAEGGLALGNTEYDHTNFANGNNFDTDDIPSSGYVGLGIEQAFAQDWSVKAEYNYLDFGSDGIDLNQTNNGGSGNPLFNIDQSMHAVKLGINRRF